jgi:tetratricopeptide (TPR) repeat protein
VTDEATQQFFISYAGVDRPWAEWVGWHLEQAGHQVILDVWDWPTGDDFVRHMDEALSRASAVVALFSKSYFDPERWTQEEWTATVARRERIIPLALEPVATADVPPLLAAKLRKDLHGLDEAAALTALREAVNGGTRPASAPSFPGGSVSPAGGTTYAGETRPRLPTSNGQPDVWNLRRRNPAFSGRESEIAQLRDGLLSGRQAAVRALHGLGGIGKTQIALEYAHRFASQYDLVWWIDAEQADQIPVHYTELAGRLGIAKPEAGPEHNGRSLLQHLRMQQRWLIIFDNAEDPSQIEPWLPEGSGHVVITSRNPDWRGIAQQTGLDVFKRSDSVSYLKTHVSSVASEQADLLAESLGDLPLALAQAAGVIGNGMTIDRYRQLVSTNTERILKEGDAPGYTASLAATVGIATARLNDGHPDAAALLHLGAFFGPEPIPTSWLENARPRLATIPGDPDDVMWPHAALQPLSRYGLARVDHEAFQIHRLTQAVLRSQTDPEQARNLRNDVATTINGTNPGNPERPSTWPEWASLVSHLTAEHVALATRPELRKLLLNAALFLILTGQPRSAISLTQSLHAVWSEDLGENHPDTLSCMQYYGRATVDAGDTSGALAIIEDAFERRRNTLGENHPDTLHSANDLAATSGRMGNHSKAHRLSEDTFQRRRRVLGDDHPDTLQSAHNVASGLNHARDFEKSRRLHEDTLRRRQATLGEDHPDTLQSAHSLAITLHEFGEHMEARRMDEDTLQRRRKILGDNHPDTLASSHSLAMTLHSLGKLAEARRMNEDALQRLRKILGEDHPDTLFAAHSLAVNLHNLGKHEEALRMDEDTLQRRRRILGDDHRHTLLSAHSFALTLYSLGETEKAHRMQEATLQRQREILGEEDPDTLRSGQALASTLRRLRRNSEAAHLLEVVRNHQRRILGDEHPDTVTTTKLLADTWSAMGKRFAAQRLLANQRKQTKRRTDRKNRSR